VPAACRPATVHANSVQVVNLVCQRRHILRVVHRGVHMFLHIERKRVLDVLVDFAAEDVEPLDCGHQDARRLLD